MISGIQNRTMSDTNQARPSRRRRRPCVPLARSSTSLTRLVCLGAGVVGSLQQPAQVLLRGRGHPRSALAAAVQITIRSISSTVTVSAVRS